MARRSVELIDVPIVKMGLPRAYPAEAVPGVPCDIQSPVKVAIV